MLEKNAQNLMKTVEETILAAEAACVKVCKPFLEPLQNSEYNRA